MNIPLSLENTWCTPFQAVMSTIQYERVWEIYNKIRPKPEDFLSATRFFVREGKMLFRDEKKKQKKKRYLFLFNDVLLFCRKEGPSRYYLRVYITLRAENVSVEEINLDHQFRLKTRQRSFIIFAPSSPLRAEWIHDLTLSINGTHVEELRSKGKALAVGDPTGEGPVETVLNADYYQKTDVVKDLLKNPPKKSSKATGSKRKEKTVQKDVYSESDSDKEEADTESSESPPKRKARKKMNRRSAPQVGDLLGLGVEISSLNIDRKPKSSGLNFQAQTPVNPFLIGGSTQPSNPFAVNTTAVGNSTGGLVSPLGSVTVNPFLQNPGAPIVNPFLNT